MEPLGATCFYGFYGPLREYMLGLCGALSGFVGFVWSSEGLHVGFLLNYEGIHVGFVWSSERLCWVCVEI